MAQKRLIAGLFWSLGLMHQRALTRVPTQITCQIFKERTGPHQGPVVDSTPCGAASSRAFPRALKRGRKYSPKRHSVNLGPRLQFPCPADRGAEAPGAARGAQYSDRGSRVKRLS